jgi:hypothetical protein
LNIRLESSGGINSKNCHFCIFVLMGSPYRVHAEIGFSIRIKKYQVQCSNSNYEYQFKISDRSMPATARQQTRDCNGSWRSGQVAGIFHPGIPAKRGCASLSSPNAGSVPQAFKADPRWRTMNGD